MKIISSKKYKDMIEENEKVKDDAMNYKKTINELISLKKSDNNELVEFILEMIKNFGKQIEYSERFLPYSIQTERINPVKSFGDIGEMHNVRAKRFIIPTIEIIKYE